MHLLKYIINYLLAKTKAYFQLGSFKNKCSTRLTRYYV